MDTCAGLSDVELGEEIVLWAGRIAAGLARQLTLIAEFDRREAWGGPGLLSCAHWLAWKTGLRPGAAREQVRVARALTGLPLLQAAFAAGRLSYSQARAVTRVAAPGDEARWVELARCSTAGQLERLVRAVRRARRIEEDAADPELAAHRMRTKVSYDEDGTFVMTVRLPAQHAPVLTAALAQVADQLDAERAAAVAVPDGGTEPGSASPRVVVPLRALPAESSDPADAPPVDVDVPPAGSESRPAAAPREPKADSPTRATATATGTATPRATPAEALLRMAQVALSSAPPSIARRGRWMLNLQVDPISGWSRLADGELLPPTSLPRTLLTAGASLPSNLLPLRRITLAHLKRYDRGRTQRQPPLALRELVGVLDGERCRFPGCTRTRGLDAHHVTFWRNGGRTDAANLLLLCGRHHTLVHRDGFVLVLSGDRRLTVHTAEGLAVPHHPGLPWQAAAGLDPARHVTAETLPPYPVEPRMDLGYAVMVMMQQAA